MSRPRFLADEDLRGSVVGAVRRMAPILDIVTIVGEHLSSATDEEVLAFAWQHALLVVSHDVSTMKPCAEQRIADGRGIHGLFLAPQARSIRMIAESLFLIGSAQTFWRWLSGGVARVWEVDVPLTAPFE